MRNEPNPLREVLRILELDDASSFYKRGWAKAERQIQTAKQDFDTALRLATQAGHVELENE